MRVNISAIGSFTLILIVLCLFTKMISLLQESSHPGLIPGNKSGIIQSGVYIPGGDHILYSDSEPDEGIFSSAPE